MPMQRECKSRHCILKKQSKKSGIALVFRFASGDETTFKSMLPSAKRGFGEASPKKGIRRPLRTNA